MRVLVLGGYGLIGLAICRELQAAGHDVTGLARSAATGPRLLPGIAWASADLADIRSAGDWKALLGNVDVVVNAAGALQDGLRDSVERVHHVAIASLAAACAETGRVRLVQVSAPGARVDSSTAFMRSKARADAAIKASGIGWVILRPGLVLGTSAFGGSALLRSLAAFPLVLPVALPDRRIQAVALADVARVAREAVEGRIPLGTDVDLVEDEPHSLREIVTRLRAWMGVPPPVATITAPPWLVSMTAGVADCLGLLGWRSPLRGTAVRLLGDEVLGDPAPLRAIRGTGLASLERMLQSMPAGVQERWFARLSLLLPLLVATLSAFWIASGAIGLVDVGRAARVIPAAAMSPSMASGLVVAGAVVDIALGAAVLLRPFARLACLGMVAVSASYLAAATFVTPGLWLDPLGPLVKVVPAAMLALLALPLLEER